MKAVLIILAIILLAGVEADIGSIDIDGLEPTDESGPQRPE